MCTTFNMNWERNNDLYFCEQYYRMSGQAITSPLSRRENASESVRFVKSMAIVCILRLCVDSY